MEQFVPYIKDEKSIPSIMSRDENGSDTDGYH
jgi:hypothetical protein